MFLLMLGLLLIGGVAHAATLEIPTPHTTLSGIGVVSGWKCDAGDLTVRFDGGPPLPLVYGSERRDVLDAGACPHDLVGFVSIMNWGNLGDGRHTAVVYDDGVEFDRSTFDVVTTGEPFLRGAAGQCIVPDFPAPNENARFIWNQATQHMELAEVGGAELLSHEGEGQECPTGTPPASDMLQHLYGNWTLTFTYTFPGCTHHPPVTWTFPISARVTTVSISGRLILDQSGYVEGSWPEELGGLPTASISGRLDGTTGTGTWFNNDGCGGTWTATRQ